MSKMPCRPPARHACSAWFHINMRILSHPRRIIGGFALLCFCVFARRHLSLWQKNAARAFPAFHFSRIPPMYLFTFRTHLALGLFWFAHRNLQTSMRLLAQNLVVNFVNKGKHIFSWFLNKLLNNKIIHWGRFACKIFTISISRNWHFLSFQCEWNNILYMIYERK